jgi:putative ABC transport system permease protein
MASPYFVLWTLGRIALQNLGRRKTRTTLLISAVAISSAIVFTGTVMMRSIENSMAVGFSRLGADLMVVTQNTLTNITAALLTVEPSDQTLDADLIERAQLAAISRVAPQRVFRSEQSGLGNGESVDLIGYDPDRDFTIGPWIAQRLNRPMQPGDVILGAARDLPLGSEVVLYGKRFNVYAKLGRSGVGTHERGVFMTSADLLALSPAIQERTRALPPMLMPQKVSGFLIEVTPEATELQARFALLSHLSGVKIVSGDSLLTAIRQGISALLDGALSLVGLMFASSALMVGVLFSGVVAERRNELRDAKSDWCPPRPDRWPFIGGSIYGDGCGWCDRRPFGRTVPANLRAFVGLFPNEDGRSVSLARPTNNICCCRPLCFWGGPDRHDRRFRARLAGRPQGPL